MKKYIENRRPWAMTYATCLSNIFSSTGALVTVTLALSQKIIWYASDMARREEKEMVLEGARVGMGMESVLRCVVF